MTRRPGLSLTEVLVALFIMGIGTIAILTLFPLGALNMAQALRDDRTAQAATQADAYLRWYVQNGKNQATTSPLYFQNEPFLAALNDPGSTTVSKYLISVNGQSMPSYPVVIDPMGQVARGIVGATVSRSFWLGDDGFGDGSGGTHSSAISRKNLKAVTDKATALQTPFVLRICTLLDGFGYDKQTGLPDTSSGAIDRDVRYNWLWVIQRPDNSAQKATMTIVVFDRRAPGFAPKGSETIFTPQAATPGSSRITFSPGQVPAVQKGGWLMDVTTVAADANGTTFYVPSATDGTGTPPAGTQPWIRNANFYRVVSITDNEVELETPLLSDETPKPPPAGATIPLPASYRRFIYLSGVAEVFVRPELDL